MLSANLCMQIAMVVVQMASRYMQDAMLYKQIANGVGLADLDVKHADLDVASAVHAVVITDREAAPTDQGDFYSRFTVQVNSILTVQRYPNSMGSDERLGCHASMYQRSMHILQGMVRMNSRQGCGRLTPWGARGFLTSVST